MLGSEQRQRYWSGGRLVRAGDACGGGNPGRLKEAVHEARRYRRTRHWTRNQRHSHVCRHHRSVHLDLCQFQAADKDDIGVILAWMDGYYRDESDPPVIDTEKFVANAKKLGEYCSKHPDTGIITAADELFAK